MLPRLIMKPAFEIKINLRQFNSSLAPIWRELIIVDISNWFVIVAILFCIFANWSFNPWENPKTVTKNCEVFFKSKELLSGSDFEILLLSSLAIFWFQNEVFWPLELAHYSWMADPVHLLCGIESPHPKGTYLISSKKT